MNELGATVRATPPRRLEDPAFLDTETPSIGCTLGGPVTNDRRSRMTGSSTCATPFVSTRGDGRDPARRRRFRRIVRTSHAADERSRVAVATSTRMARGLSEFTRNLTQLAASIRGSNWSTSPPRRPVRRYGPRCRHCPGARDEPAHRGESDSAVLFHRGVGGRARSALYAAGYRRCVQWVTGRPPRRLGVGDAGHYRVPPMRSPWE